MLGHQLWRHFHKAHETWVTLRKPAASFRPWNLFNPDFTQVGVEADDFAQLDAVLRKVRPDVVLNCVGIVNWLMLFAFGSLRWSAGESYVGVFKSVR